MEYFLYKFVQYFYNLEEISNASSDSHKLYCAYFIQNWNSQIQDYRATK